MKKPVSVALAVACGVFAVFTSIATTHPVFSRKPLPYATISSLYEPETGRLSGFSIKVDGRAVTYDTEVKALHNGRDVTDALKAAGLTPQQIARLPFDKTLLSVDPELLIPKEQRDALQKADLSWMAPQSGTSMSRTSGTDVSRHRDRSR